MSYKHMPRLGSAIASTILSVFSAMSLVGVDKAQAAVLTYDIGDYGGSRSYFKVDNSSLTGIGLEQIPVSEGRFYGFTLGGREFYDLTNPRADQPGASAIFYQGEFTGLEARDSESFTVYLTDPSDPEGGPSDNYFISYVAFWSIDRMPMGLNTWVPLINGYTEVYYYPSLDVDRRVLRDYEFSYTLLNTEPSPVPEPLTAGGTALALAGLSWLKHKKKMAA
jgi:hypothetical protein